MPNILKIRFGRILDFVWESLFLQMGMMLVCMPSMKTEVKRQSSRESIQEFTTPRVVDSTAFLQVPAGVLPLPLSKEER